MYYEADLKRDFLFRFPADIVARGSSSLIMKAILTSPLGPEGSEVLVPSRTYAIKVLLSSAEMEDGGGMPEGACPSEVRVHQYLADRCKKSVGGDLHRSIAPARGWFVSDVPVDVTTSEDLLRLGYFRPTQETEELDEVVETQNLRDRRAVCILYDYYDMILSTRVQRGVTDGNSTRSFMESVEGAATHLPKLMDDLMKGVSFLVENRVAHLDIKPDNVAVMRDDRGGFRALLLDFGRAVIFQNDAMTLARDGLVENGPVKVPVGNMAVLPPSCGGTLQRLANMLSEHEPSLLTSLADAQDRTDLATGGAMQPPTLNYPSYRDADFFSLLAMQSKLMMSSLRRELALAETRERGLCMRLQKAVNDGDVALELNLTSSPQSLRREWFQVSSVKMSINRLMFCRSDAKLPPALINRPPFLSSPGEAESEEATIACGALVNVPGETGEQELRRCFVAEHFSPKCVAFQQSCSVEDFGEYFLAGCDEMTHLDLSGLSFVRLVRPGFLFRCSSLVSIDLTSLSRIASIPENFMSGCTALQCLDLHMLDRLIFIYPNFLKNCTQLKKVRLPLLAADINRNIRGWVGSGFLSGCTSLQQVENLSNLFDSALVDKTHFMELCVAPEIAGERERFLESLREREEREGRKSTTMPPHSLDELESSAHSSE